MRAIVRAVIALSLLAQLSALPVLARGQEMERENATRDEVNRRSIETRRAVTIELDHPPTPSGSILSVNRELDFEMFRPKLEFPITEEEDLGLAANFQEREQLDPPIFRAQPSASCKRYFEALGATGKSATEPVVLTHDEKLKIRDSRGCMITFWPPGVGEHGELVDADKMRSLRDSVEAFSEGKLLPHDKMQQYLTVKKEFHNIDVQQHLLFADFVLLQKLMGEGRFAEASKEGWRIIEKRHLQAKLVLWTEADEATYVSRDNLSNLIILATAQARCKTEPTSASDELRFLVFYLDSKPSLMNTFGRLDKPDSTNELVQRVGNKDWYSLDEESWSRDEKLAKLKPVLGANKDGNGFLLLLRGKHIYAVKVEEGEEAKLLTGSEAADAYSRSLNADLKAHSTADMQLFAVSQFGNSYEILFGEATPSVTLTEQELSRLRAGQPLPKEHALSKLVRGSHERTLVVYTNPLMFRDSKQLRASDEIAFALVKAYPEARILRDPFSERTNEQVRKLNALGVSVGAKTVAVVAEDSFEVKDYKLVQNLEDTLRGQGISIVPVSKDNVQKASIQWTQAAGSLVLVITGHIDSKLAAFVRALGDAGVFRENYVVFNSCRAKLSRQLASEMATRYGATGVFTYDSLITPEALEPVLLGIQGSVKANSDRPFIDSWRENVGSHKLNGIWTICDTFNRLIEASA